MNQIPRLSIANLPTPIEALPRLSAHLGGPRLFIKRDDLTGLALGGNKTRKPSYNSIAFCKTFSLSTVRLSCFLITN